ncbi:coiled-coil domain-containing protein 69 isoform X2 [Sebastes fasciatus]|uniref:coiled-coil domain-containing protein 69 isoform X2 n=1 Tax=Sebastes fasciatus TaxID=394691 RepID=UPI003D9DDADF
MSDMVKVLFRFHPSAVAVNLNVLTCSLHAGCCTTSTQTKMGFLQTEAPLCIILMSKVCNVQSLQKKHQQEKTQLTEKFQAAENVLKGEVEQLTADLQVYNELKRRVKESTFKKDLQRNIKAHGSPGAFWESEQESLLFVIEMKSERVQEQSRKLQQMDDLVEKNLLLEDQIIHTLQQNEDLRVRIDNSQTFIQQLSKEQQDLKVALERQAVINQNLSQEKEQLMFKLRHRDSCPTIHLPAMMQEIAPR